ncbi:WYL domain-containing protein [Streptomyces sp. NBC_00555]|uniref:helix-turn-helix transcriptional regulator n=1 Tax=Streptomyces sp. NBC_00555 TaxID=2903662 RepID=UPI0022566A5F|nr:WYL domain-containing protein [Streptomyces sp. NBC_00555]MCX5012508.1 WYL domain-containing protein [Streptomyces sp. NBC_00555]
MKSSRLLSILLLLQTRGRMTATELARELEVSVRTVYRDAEALAAAGVPLFGDAGHSGGYQLLAGYRTRLTGLSTGEAEALFLTGMPGPAAELGLGRALSAAQLKLRAALPPELRAQADRMRLRFHLDAPGWYAEHEETPYLAQVADAVWRGRVIEVRYRRWKEPREVDRRLAPYGLVLKAGRWYLVAGPDGARTYRVDQILSVTETTQTADLPEGFDLATHWRQTQADFHARLYPEEAEVRLSARAAARLTGAQSRALTATGHPDPEIPGWTRATLPIESHTQAESQFLALGTEAEVLSPPALRTRIQTTLASMTSRYA